MKKFIGLFLSLALACSSFAQMSGYSSSQSDGTALGANLTSNADGISLSNAVKLRGYIQTTFSHIDSDGDVNPTDIDASADLDFLVNLSPVTAEVHLNPSATGGHGTILEQAFARYSFSQDFHLTFGKQVTVLGFDGDEAPDLYAVTAAFRDVRKDYVEGFRLNYNNGFLGLVFGIHDTYGLAASRDDIASNQPHLDDGMAIDLAASIMFFPGLEAQLGFANENGPSGEKEDTQRFNGWVSWNPGDLTLAFEFDNIDYYNNEDELGIMLMANYQFSDFLGATFRYAHLNRDSEDVNRITLAALLSLSENLGINFEYSHTSSDEDENEFYIEGLITY